MQPSPTPSPFLHTHTSPLYLSFFPSPRLSLSLSLYCTASFKQCSSLSASHPLSLIAIALLSFLSLSLFFLSLTEVMPHALYLSHSNLVPFSFPLSLPLLPFSLPFFSYVLPPLTL